MINNGRVWFIWRSMVVYNCMSGVFIVCIHWSVYLYTQCGFTIKNGFNESSMIVRVWLTGIWHQSLISGYCVSYYRYIIPMPRGDTTLSVWLKIVCDTDDTCCVDPAWGGALAMCIMFSFLLSGHDLMLVRIVDIWLVLGIGRHTGLEYSVCISLLADI